MSSGTAFATTANDIAHNSNGNTNDRPPKRTRLADDAVASVYSQTLDSETSLEVDHMILDHVTYQTIESCLSSRVSERQTDDSHNLGRDLAMSDAFLSIFKTRHASYRPDPELRLRLQLLKLATLHTQRFTRNPTTPTRDELRTLRGLNQDRARRWIEDASRIPSAPFDYSLFEQGLPIAEQRLERNRAHVLREVGIPPEDDHYDEAFYGTSSCISLLDLIPLFMQVSAARNAINESNLTTTWMQLACALMLQACLEQYLVFGAHGTDAIDEAFAWGYKPSKQDPPAADDIINGSGSRQDEINSMFEHEDYEVEVEGWADMKASALELLFGSEPDGPTPADETVSRLEAVAAQSPAEAVETQLLAFYTALSDSISRPILVQLEAGQLDGMTVQETNNFLLECGIRVFNLGPSHGVS
jgi:hypothetical protein